MIRETITAMLAVQLDLDGNLVLSHATMMTCEGKIIPLRDAETAAKRIFAMHVRDMLAEIDP